MVEAAITFVLAAALIYRIAYRSNQGGEGLAAKKRVCPECTSSISAAAKRCSFCTAVVQPDSTS
ncbi:MAG TPA: hypothetical protein VIY71_10130 [Solirubrobacterales bacterium]